MIARMPLWVALNFTWTMSMFVVTMSFVALGFTRPGLGRKLFNIYVASMIALTPLPVVASVLSGDPFPGSLGVTVAGWFIYLWFKYGGGGRWRKKIKKLIGEKGRAARAKLTVPRLHPVGA